MPNYKDDKFTIIDREIEKIRARPTQYVGSIGQKGILHICKELIDNNADECFKAESWGNNIEVFITKNQIMSKDNGRGIPIDLVRKIHETIQAGSNMKRVGGTTAGENGVGTVTYTALSSEITIISRRPQDKKKITLIYQEGDLIEEKIEDYFEKESGMITTFIPSKKIFGTDVIPINLIKEWLKDNYDYTLPKRINMEYTINGKKFEVKHKELYEYLNERIEDDKRLCEPIPFQCKGTIEETVQGETTTKEFNVEACVVYTDSSFKNESIRQSWMNRIHNDNNGHHMDGTIKGLQQYLIERVIKKSPKMKDEDLKRDTLLNLHVVVKATCTMANMFSGQSKERVESIPLGNHIKKAVYEALNKMSQTRLDELVEIVIQNNRVRKAGEEARNISSASKAFKKWEKPDSYIPCSSKVPKHQRELYLVEGFSALGGIRAAKENNQAILAFRGKNLNVWDEDLTRVLKADARNPWINLVQILECGIGPTFNIDKLAFDKIFICTDADIDGYHIRTGFLAFFFKYMPQIIHEQKLFIAEPPLYRLTQNKKDIYVASQPEYVEACIASLSDIQIEFID